MRLLMLIAAATALALSAASAGAQARLIVNATGFVMPGKVVAFDGVNYTFDSNIGRIVVPAVYVQCQGPGCPGAAEAGGAFGVYGSNTVGATLMPSIVESYAQSLGGLVERELTTEPLHSRLLILDGADERRATVDLWAEGSGSSFPALASGDAQIGMSSRPAKDSEVQALAEAGVEGLRGPGKEHVLALDGLIVIVARDNSFRSISLEDVARIFSGEISNWSQLGGPNAPINVYARDDVSGTWDTFNSLVLKRFDKELTPTAQRFASNAQLSDAVAADPNGIGFTGFAFERNARALPLNTSCGLTVSPREFAVKTEEYPLARRLYLYTTGRTMDPTAADLLGYALSDDAQPVVRRVGFVDQSVEAGAPGAEDDRLFGAVAGARDAMETMLSRSAAAELAGAARLSTTFRFDADGALDVKAQGDASRVARYIAENLKPGQEVVLVGYTDDRPSVTDSFAQALAGADRVRQAIGRDLGFLGINPDVMTSLAYGALAPVACNDNENGRAANRRVEVWIR